MFDYLIRVSDCFNYIFPQQIDPSEYVLNLNPIIPCSLRLMEWIGLRTHFLVQGLGYLKSVKIWDHVSIWGMYACTVAYEVSLIIPGTLIQAAIYHVQTHSYIRFVKIINVLISVLLLYFLYRLLGYHGFPLNNRWEFNLMII